jgi:hypothetical protein
MQMIIRILFILIVLGQSHFLFAQDTILINNPIVVSYIDSLRFDTKFRNYYIASDDVHCKSRLVFLDSTFTKLVYSILLINDSAFFVGYWLNGNIRTRDILITKDEDLCPYYVTRRELYYENGNLAYRIDSADLDIFREFKSYYCDGSVQRSCMLNALRGLVIGVDTTFYQNGKIKSLEKYEGQYYKCGFAYHWNENGRLVYVKEYDCKTFDPINEYKIGFFTRRKWNKRYRSGL